MVYQVATASEAEYLLGPVEQLLDTGANDVLVVRGTEGEILVPYRPGEVVKSVDLEAGRMLVDWFYD